MQARLLDLAAQFARVLPGDSCPPEIKRAQGMPGARCARSLAWKIKNHTSIVTTVTPEITRHSPRNGFNGFLRALLGDRACLPPSSAEINSANLMPASGHQDHTTSPSAHALFVRSTSASTASRTNVRDDRETPLSGTGRTAYVADLRAMRSGIFLVMEKKPL
jgi:hypothetical protein